MKRLLALSLAFALLCSLAACGGASGASSAPSAGADGPMSDGPGADGSTAAEGTTLRDMSAEIANPNLAGKFTANIGVILTEQGDWVYYRVDRSIYRVRLDTMDFTTAELLFEESEFGPPSNLNISGKYLYYFAYGSDDGTVRQLDLETGEAISLTGGEYSCFSLFYYDGYLYESGKETGFAGAPDTFFVRRMAVPAQGSAQTEQLYTETYTDSRYTRPYILGVNEQGLYLYVPQYGIMCIADGVTTTVYDNQYVRGAAMVGDIIYLRRGDHDIYALSLVDGSLTPVYTPDLWSIQATFSATTDGRPLVCDGTDLFYADTGEIISSRSISGIYPISNGGIFFSVRDMDDNGLYYMDQYGGNITVVHE